MKLNWNFQRGGEVLEKSLPWGRYGYFLELHITFSQLCYNLFLVFQTQGPRKELIYERFCTDVICSAKQWS